MQVMLPTRTLPSSIVFPVESVLAEIGTTMGRFEFVWVIGAAIVFGDVLLNWLDYRMTQGLSLFSSLPMPMPNLHRYTSPLYMILFLAELAIAFKYIFSFSHSRYCWVFESSIFIIASFVNPFFTGKSLMEKRMPN